MIEWKNIKDFPKDGTPVDLWHKDGFRHTDVWWCSNDGLTNLMDLSEFTHFAIINPPEFKFVEQYKS